MTDKILSNGNPALSDTEIDACVASVLNDGYALLKNFLTQDKIAAWRDAFIPILHERIQAEKASSRGPNRYYLSLPFEYPFSDPSIYENPSILAVIERLAGEPIAMPELAVDTPLQGSDYQVIHRDAPLLSEYLPDVPPERPYQFAVNFPLVDVTQENGPFQVIPGTHIMEDDTTRAYIQSGEAEKNLISLQMKAGDVMIRDVRGLHRGSPNKTDQPRPMVVVGYNTARHQRPQLRIFISKESWETLSPRSQELLRFNPVSETAETGSHEETYSNLNFL